NPPRCTGLLGSTANVALRCHLSPIPHGGHPAKIARERQSALVNLQRVLVTAPEQSAVALAASHKIGQDLYRATWLLDIPKNEAVLRIADVDLKRAECLVRHYSNHAKSAFSSESPPSRLQHPLPVPAAPFEVMHMERKGENRSNTQPLP